MTSSELLQARLPGAHVVKAFNHIYARQITTDGMPPDTRNRRALAIAGDDPVAKRRVAELIDGFGFDVVDAGPLAESWRIQPGTPGYVQRLNIEELTSALAAANGRTKSRKRDEWLVVSCGAESGCAQPAFNVGPMLRNLLASHRQTFTDPRPWARGGVVTHGAAKATDRVRDERVDRLAGEVVAVGEG